MSFDYIPILGGAGLTLALLALAIIDARTLRLPDRITGPLIACGLLFMGLTTDNWWLYISGAVIGYAVFVLIEVAYRRIRGHHGLGRGDAKLLAAGGAWCGALTLPYIVLIGSASALIAIIILRERIDLDNGKIAFGPYLAFGIVCVYWARLLA